MGEPGRYPSAVAGWKPWILQIVYIHAPSPTNAMVRTPAGRSDDDRSNPTNAPLHAAYNNLKHSSSSALVGKMLNDPKACDFRGRLTGDRPAAATTDDDDEDTADDDVAAISAAYAAGENVGPKRTTIARNTVLAPIINDRFVFLCNTLAVQR